MRTLLLADDSVTTQRVIALTFAEESFRVVTVSDGQQALDAMAAMRPDIVLASTTLPRITGYDLAQQMRGIPALRDVPVLLLSGAFESVDAARLKASDARGVIEKPLEPTAVISRVRELLGFKDTRPAAPAGRLVTSAEGPADRKRPARSSPPPAPRAPVVSTWDELRKETGLEPDAHSVEGGPVGSGREDYLDTLDAAFDSLDQHLAGRRHDTPASHRNPSPPLGQASGAADPRSPGRRPSMTTEGGGANSVFEVDNDWFSDDHKARDRAATDEMVADAHAAMSPRTPAAPGSSIFEVDDEWFAEDAQARVERATIQRNLAVEMGIHDIDLPVVEPGLNVPASLEGLDFDFGLDELGPLLPPAGPVPDSPFAPPVVAPPAPMPVAVAPVVPPPAPVVLAPMPSPVPLPSLLTNAPWAAAPAPVVVAPVPEVPSAPIAPAPSAPAPTHWAPQAPSAPSSVADDFAALLAFETGDALEPPPSVAATTPSAPIVVQAVAPEITEVMLDQIAQRVADRLNSSNFGADLRAAMTSAIRDTVRTVVSDTSERLVREEIGRVKAKVERDTP